MKLPRRQLAQLAGAAVAVIFVALSGYAALSQTTRTIKIVVPTPPGTGADVLTRTLADQIGLAQKPTFVIENRARAGTVIGTEAEAVARAAPDGKTLLLVGNPFLINPHLRKLNYDPLTSFEPICLLVSFPQVIGVNSTSPFRTLADLFDGARAKPGALTLASIGPGSGAQIGFEKLKRTAKVDMTFVPYPGDAPAINALLGEHVKVVWTNYTTLAEQIKAGKLHALAVSSLTRIAALPDVPTIAEAGYKGIDPDLWYGLFAPAKTPKETISELAGWFMAALDAPEVRAKLIVQGYDPVGTCGADFGGLIRKQYEEYGRVIREANIKAE
jgi:tripartite-type tricarboxylate transporter receptor subunit TctC